ncbi:MAG: hypothetical protein CSA58_00965 [Micrococcales bacterium]|nr:MAG: hypothetical protein CSB46_02230 [Micrococcales bacterium]PIE28056.1 MAG: hypothetical protein CSA58_00965 [Micrococcales bacterium]
MVQREHVERLRERHPAWRLLRADSAALVIGFLGRLFVEDNARSVAADVLASALDDELYDINQQAEPPLYPRAAKDYLDDWVDAGWLRKYYPGDADEPHFDATPALEKAVAWVGSLAEKSFVGTESRLNTIVDLLRQMAFGAETDPQARLVELHRRRAEIDAQIEQVESGVVDLLDDTALRDRYQQFAETARQLLSDFRQVEANFRDLDRSMRAKIAGWSGSKADLLADVLGGRAQITESDQGRSFQAFHDYLLSSARQDELEELLGRVHAVPAIEADRRMRHVHQDWLDAGEQTQAMVRQLSEELRRFLDDQVWLENRRVMEVLKSIEHHALQLQDEPKPGITTSIDDLRATVTLPFDRPLYAPAGGAGVDSSLSGQPADQVDATVLYTQQYVDTDRLMRHLAGSLAGHDQVGLAAVIGAQPLEQGLAELVAYLATELPGVSQVVDHAGSDVITWRDESGERDAALPRVTFVRTRENP